MRKKIDREKINKYATELGNSIFTNEPNLTPERLTMATVTDYAEGAGFDDLSDAELKELIYVTFHANHMTFTPSK